MDGQALLELLREIDYESLLYQLTPLTIALAHIKITKINKYKLARYAQPFGIERVCLTPKVIPKKKHIHKYINKNFDDRLNEFLGVITNRSGIDAEDLSILYKNLSRLIVSTAFIYKENIGGTYNIITNHITLFTDDYLDSTIFHELFHVSNSMIKNGICYSGFSQSKLFGSKVIGVGLNEGYTEFMTEKCFKKIVDTYYAYEVIISSCLDEIVGINKMEKLYLHADLSGLIGELSRYASYEEITQFISSLDAYHNREALGDELKPKNTDIILKHAYDINTFVFKSYFRKLLMQYEDDEIGWNELISKAHTYFYNFKVGCDIHNLSYKKLHIEEVYSEQLAKLINLDELEMIKIKKKLYN
ncbi:MAG: hypothetical protein IKP79_03000 [Bacilli bacterium]|nr:hypothetical protein [Bacilli bacterium]